ncbi:battenin CLN3 protein [Malassezia cuniculi]|uniref:Protein BTN n=1 Tax=Malassezia cuniculi TaxID=948313 RepID=A0AAF0EW96_9BASI|nr:battenin CLN3 protein [Malassezia cuniculi]
MEDMSMRIRAPSVSPASITDQWRRRAAFFTFGLTNNGPYVVILAAALELLPKSVPTGVLLFVNIAPALVGKAVFPYLLKGEIQYGKRVALCTALAFCGMIIIATFESLTMRLFGIALASFSSGVGEVTYLQYTTRLRRDLSSQCVGHFASGTGAAGLLCAFAWWLVRPLGVKTGITLLSVLPLGMAFGYFVLLPAIDEQSSRNTASSSVKVSLSFDHKMRLLRPMLFPYVLPLVTVYFAEYTINQGVAPTLLYPVPSPERHPLLALLIHSLRDYYPLYQLVYQAFVFCSRSYTSLTPLAPIPKKWLWSPAIVQVLLLALLSTESVYAWFKKSIASPLVIVLVACEGLAGGAAYVSVMSRLSVLGKNSAYTPLATEDTENDNENDNDADVKAELEAQAQEFQIGCVGLADTFGILVASLVSIPLQLILCRLQVGRGRDLCTRV